jgi:hypothetical protein
VTMGDSPFGSDRRASLFLYDFSVLSEKQGAESLSDMEDGEKHTGRHRRFDNRHVRRSRIADRSTNVHVPEIFRHNFRSVPSYRMIETKEVFDWDSVMVDDERIVGLKVCIYLFFLSLSFSVYTC